MIPCVAILAGGKGTRIASLLGNTPKALAPVAGRPFIYHLLDQIQEAGVKLAVLCTGNGADIIEKELGDWYQDVKIVYSKESAPLGTGGALRNALSYLNTDSVLVLNGDSYCDTRLKKFITWFADKNIKAAMMVANVPDASRFGIVNSSAGQLIESFRHTSREATQGEINAGIYLLAKNLIAQIPSQRRISLETDLFPLWIKQKLMRSFSADASFIDIGTPESYAKAEFFFRDAVLI